MRDGGLGDGGLGLEGEGWRVRDGRLGDGGLGVEGRRSEEVVRVAVVRDGGEGGTVIRDEGSA